MSTLKAGRPSKKDKAISSVQEKHEDVIKMNVNLPKSFHKLIKQQALDEDISVTELVKKALNEYLNK